jgi:hypothetical protein
MKMLLFNLFDFLREKSTIPIHEDRTVQFAAGYKDEWIFLEKDTRFTSI